MKTPLVSIIIPCFNSAEFVADAIDSALSQHWSRVEVIVVDDGSTDETLDVLKGFGDRIRWVTGPNGGACAARNTGLAMARGEYVQFLDSDDLLHPKKISRSVPILALQPNALLYCFHEVIALDPSQPKPFQWNRKQGNEDAIAFMLAGDLPTPSPLHRRAILESTGGFDETLTCAQDREFHLRLAMAGIRFLLLPEILVTVRRRRDSLGESNRAGIEIQRGRIAWSIYLELLKTRRLTDGYQVGCAAMLMKASRALIRSNPEMAASFRAQAFRIHPSGGLQQVYSRPALLALRVLGPRMTEEIALRLRQVRSNIEASQT